MSSGSWIAFARRGRLGLGTILAAGLVAGCAQPEFGHLEVDQVSNSPAPVDVTSDLVTIPVGIALNIKVKPVSSSRQGYTANDDLSFETENTSVMEAFQIEESSKVVITGVRVGETCLRVIVNHREVDCLRVEVVDQEVAAEGDQ